MKTDGIDIGDEHYTLSEAIAIMKRKGVKGNKIYNMFEQLVAAKINVAIGNASGCINDTILDADSWMSTYGPVENSIDADSDAWQTEGGEYLHGMLDDYNNGLLCAPHRD